MRPARRIWLLRHGPGHRSSDEPRRSDRVAIPSAPRQCGPRSRDGLCRVPHERLEELQTPGPPAACDRDELIASTSRSSVWTASRRASSRETSLCARARGVNSGRGIVNVSSAHTRAGLWSRPWQHLGWDFCRNRAPACTGPRATREHKVARPLLCASSWEGRSARLGIAWGCIGGSCRRRGRAGHGRGSRRASSRFSPTAPPPTVAPSIRPGSTRTKSAAMPLLPITWRSRPPPGRAISAAIAAERSMR